MNMRKYFSQLNIISYNEFYNNDSNEALIAGTIMSIQEKKALKVRLMRL